MKNKLKFLVVVGARPNFIKIAPLFEEFKKYKSIKPILVHTGQHYDFEMSQVFFDGLRIPKPNYNLGVGSGSHGVQTAKTMLKLEPVVLKEKPDIIVVVGDVNSTIAAALVAKKLNIPLAHIEAGMRSYDSNMPEEINRILTDQISDFLFVTSESDKKNLLREGIDSKKIFIVGNIMTDTLLKMINKATGKILEKLSLKKNNYAFLTIHRAENTNKKEILKGILEAISRISERIPIVFPIHPRTKKNVEEFGIETILKSQGLITIPPVSYIDSIGLMKNAIFVLTDSGGIQHETAMLGVPCLTLRKNTEWSITIKSGSNRLIGVSKVKIIKAVFDVIGRKKKRIKTIKYWDGKTSQRIVRLLYKKIN
ncbi:MAG: UDP-N-acetylglucosamine 2-epimerase, partial [Parcubacteria group bacterium GW2011_GWC1_38_6]